MITFSKKMSRKVAEELNQAGPEAVIHVKIGGEKFTCVKVVNPLITCKDCVFLNIHCHESIHCVSQDCIFKEVK